MRWTPRNHAIVGSVTLLLAATAFVSFGLIGAGRVNTRAFKDLDSYLRAGDTWLAGLSPYDLEAINAVIPPGEGLWEIPFPYPPQSAALCIPLASLPVPVAQGTMAVLNLLSVIALALVTARLATDALEKRPASSMAITRWLLPAVVVVSPFAAHVAYLGQSSLLLAAALAWGWYLVYRGRPIAGGILLGLTTFKPHLAVLPFLWLLLERRWRVLAGAAATSCALALPAFFIAGPLASMRGWLVALTRYQSFGPNSYESDLTVGVPSLLASQGVAVPGPRVWLTVAVALMLFMWCVRARICPDDVLGVLIALQCALTFAHVQDLVLLAPLISSLWLHIAHRPTIWPWAIGWLGLLYLPARIVRLTGSLPLQQWRVPVVLAAAAATVALGWREREAGAGGRGQPPRTAGA